MFIRDFMKYKPCRNVNVWPIFFGLLLLFSSYGVSGQNFIEYNSGNSSELVSSVQLTGGCNCNNATVYEIDFGESLSPGDVLIASAEVEVSTPPYQPLVGYNGYPISVVTAITITDSRYLVSQNNNSGFSGVFGFEVAEENGPNIFVPEKSRQVSTKVGSVVVPNDGVNYRYAYLWLRAASVLYQSSHAVQITPDAGRLSVVRIVSGG